ECEEFIMKRLLLPLLLLAVALLAAPALAQNDPALEITGTVTVIDETTIEVGGLTIDVSGVPDIVFADGMVATISGNLEGMVVVAASVVIEAAEPEPTPEPSPEPEVVENPDINMDITIVIEGPVETVAANMVTIYGFEVELPESDPRIMYVQVGDKLRVRGHHKGQHHHLRNAIIVAIVFDFVDIDMIVFDNQVWRDPLTCVLAPPAWADELAVHWHGRCDTTIIIVPSGGGGVPSNCKVTGMGGIKCSGGGSRRSG
ncbi:hypothetical protein ACFLYO_10410, partial [Chloroflexota bacterium]